MRLNILVLGAGAVGLSGAAKLPAAADVHAICRNISAKAIEVSGFKMTGIRGDGTYRFSAGETVPAGISVDASPAIVSGFRAKTLCNCVLNPPGAAGCQAGDRP